MKRFVPCLALLGGCAGDVVIRGVVADARGSRTPLVDAPLVLRDDAFEVLARTRTDAEGVFELDAPRDAIIHLIVAGAGNVPAAFPGLSGQQDVFEVPPGDLFAIPEDDLADWADTFAGCPGAGEGPPSILGELRLAGVTSAAGDAPIAPDAFAFLSSPEGPEVDRVDACYLDADGVVDPDARSVGPRGRFAIFGVEGGPWVLTTANRIAAGSRASQVTVFVPEDGVVVQLPALVAL